MTANKPNLDKRKRLPVIWFIPVLALVLGVSMIVKTKLSEGPKITIRFDTADGITAGKTKIRYLNVEAGLVKEVTLTEDKQAVLVAVELVPEAAELLREDTEFWVVRARVGAGNVSGLGTLLGGAYIELSPGEGAVGGQHYVGLETPPLSPIGAPGLRLNLFADKAGSVGIGDGVLYNGYKVGVVEGMSFDQSKGMVRYDLFVDAPFDKLVTSTVRFWNISGIQMKASASGIEVQTGSMDTVLFGGVAFAVPEGAQPGVPVENETEFKLYDSFATMQEQPYVHGLEYVMEFEQSLRGLLPGAPVEYRGIELGYVKRIMVEELNANREEVNKPIPVLIRIEPGRIGLPDARESVETIEGVVQKGVRNGMRGSLASGNMLTGSLFVEIIYRDDLEEQTVGEFLGHKTIPTVPTGLKRIEEQVASLLEKLNALPLDRTLDAIDGTVLAFKDTLVSIDALVEDAEAEQIPAEIAKTLEGLREVLGGLGTDSPLYEEAQASLSKLHDVLYSIDQLAETVKDQPNSILFNPKLPKDPVPGPPKQ